MTSSLAWGSQANLTYDQLLDQILDDPIYSKKVSLTAQQNSKTLPLATVKLAKFGRCYEIISYDPLIPIIFPLYVIEKSIIIYVTDKRQQTFHSRAFSSQIGSRIFIEPRQFYSYQLDVELKSGGFVVSLDDDCVKKSAKSFYDCVEKFTQEQNLR
jgi:hypothetical protein